MQSSAWRSDRNCRYAEEIARFIRQNPQRTLSTRQLSRLLEQFKRLWTFMDDLRSSEPFAQYVLHYLTQRAYFSGIRDSRFVAELLSYLFQTDGHFGFFLCPPESNGHFAKFFLAHAYRDRMTVNGRRLADVEVFCRSIWLHPCEMAVVSECPAMLRTLLQYGALTTDQSMSLQRFRSHPAAGSLLVITLCVLKTLAELRRAESRIQIQDVQDSRRRFRDMADCARLLMRVSPQIGTGILRHLALDFPGFESSAEALEWIARTAVPELEFRTVRPISLKHACRLRVRKVLYDGWQLPEGVDALSIPNCLKEYLNLECD